MTKRCIFVSSTKPRSGKDLSAKYLQSFFTDLGYSCEVHAFKNKLIEVACDILNISSDEFLDGYDETTEDYLSKFSKEEQLTRFNVVTLLHAAKTKWWKDVRQYNTNGRFYSKREWIIHTSEKVFKPHCGEDFFGQAAARRIDNQDIIIYSDSGFADETIPVIEKVGRENCMVVQLIREGYDSGVNDSRKLLEPEDYPEHLRPRFVRVTNENVDNWQEVLENKLQHTVAQKVLEGM